MRLLLFIIGGLLQTLPVTAQWPALNSDATPLHRAEKALTDVMVHDVFSPNVASRVYAYANIAAYEILAAQNKGYHSLHGQIRSFPMMPAPAAGSSSSMAAVYAFLLVGKRLVFSEQALDDSITSVLRWYKDKKLPANVQQKSLAYGKQVADTIMQWVNADQYRETRRLRRYNFSRQEGRWLPTPPGYMAAIEPYWNKIRPLTLDSASQFQPPLPTVYNRDKQSVFYKQAYEVYQAGVQMTPEQRETANFWDCNPFFLNTQGHLNFAAKKISPAGHWISIVGIACRQTENDIMAAAAAYTITSIALFDGFISCWDEKYRSNLIRPETYINANIDETWRPLLQTPPFPEYTSGHSVISTAASVVLGKMLGNELGFYDNSEVDYGLPVRYFSSFEAAANQAAISRLYGGIHFRPAIENGQEQGRKIGEWVLSKIRLEDN